MKFISLVIDFSLSATQLFLCVLLLETIFIHSASPTWYSSALQIPFFNKNSLRIYRVMGDGVINSNAYICTRRFCEYNQFCVVIQADTEIQSTDSNKMNVLNSKLYTVTTFLYPLYTFFLFEFLFLFLSVGLFRPHSLYSTWTKLCLIYSMFAFFPIKFNTKTIEDDQLLYVRKSTQRIIAVQCIHAPTLVLCGIRVNE